MTEPAEKLPEAPASGEQLTREQRRSRRKRDVRARTVPLKRMKTNRERVFLAVIFPASEIRRNQAERPQTRADCVDGCRPCPWVGCKYNLYLDTSAKTGAIKLNFPDLAAEDMPPEKSCALDVADRSGATLKMVGELTNTTRERIRQIEVVALAKVALELDDDPAVVAVGDAIEDFRAARRAQRR